MSRSRVQCRGRGKWFGVRGNWVKTTDMKNIKGRNRFYARYSTVANFPQRGIQNPRLSWIPLVHRAITGIYLPNLLSFLSSGGVDNLLFSVSGLLSFSASWNRALLFPYLLTHLVAMHVFQIWLRRTMNGFLLSGCPGCHLGEKNKELYWTLRVAVSVVKIKALSENLAFCGLLLVSILNSCLEYRLNEVSCSCLHFLYFCRKHLLNIRVLVSSTDRLVAFRARK